MAGKSSESGNLTLSGRFNHYSSIYLGFAARAFARRNSRVYTSSGGTRGNKLQGKPVFQLIVTGRKSGEPRPVMLMLVRDGDDILVCGSNGGHPGTPNWWHNLAAQPTARVQVGPDTWPVDVRIVTDDEEYEKHWRTLVAGYPDFATYRALSPREFPVAVLSRATGK
ncbi:nitroreductase family deazaflavin-dependent oxidoreductase [Nocardia sp. NBC_01503]|uniref:nitroreductase/quinone reductase family protein n=1 Tax=Nocardia sp. NBC_01503 TaxID=2975997 RepID=UPI002E7B2ED9|nr:nitroreductase/quinone reductase family protein [Nocardia sp. NBC_01503]WTL32305.1 nitroreductase family deazaflavin-dependent oxidoreductase [Nocardia sp. NBC_01503]